VRMWPTAPPQLALTEFSSSTGGHTAPGSPRTINGVVYRFPAVPDLGDDVCRTGSACNPRHAWRADIPVTTIQAAYPQLGTLQSIDVTQRNGLGEFGGRVEQVVLRGSSGNVTLTGDQFRAAFTDAGVYSRWFSISGGTVYAGGAVNPQSTGYWLVSAQGEVLAFGAAQKFGDLAAMRLNQPIVGMARTPSGAGYWLVASDGGIFSYGDATFYGSTGAMRLNRPVVGMEPTAAGYWLVASDGGIFSYGDAVFRGSTGAITLNRPVTGMSATPGGQGYTLIASDGGTFNFGNAAFHGSLPGIGVSATAVALSHTASGLGYYVFTSSGGVYPFGDAPAITSAAGAGD